MIFTCTRIDLAACFAAKHDPQDVVARQPGEIWMVPYTAIEPGKRANWAVCQSEEFVRIPLQPYLASMEPDLAMAYMVQLGVMALSKLESRGNVVRLHLAVGNPVDQDDAAELPNGRGPALRFFLGIGLVVR